MIYKTFIAPTLEFGLGITYHWIKAEPEQRSNIYDQLENTLDECLKWITGLPKFRRVNLSVLGLCDMRHRALEHAYRLSVQLRQADASNPILIFRNASSCVLNSQALAPRCFRNTTFNPESNLSYHDMRQVYLQSLNAELVLSCCILNRSQSLFDRSIKFTDPSTRRMALLWRNNLLYHHRICPICKHRFHRTHINECNIFNLRQKVHGFKNLPESYNYIDHLLNLGKEIEFKTLIYRLTSLLVKVSAKQEDES